MRFEASNVARITSGTLVGADCVADGIAFDSRVLQPGNAFVAIKGDADGHQFLLQASLAGASFAIVARGQAAEFMPCVEVDDTVLAIAQVAHALVQTLPAFHAHRVVAITGSAGKTSTKDLVFAVLNSGFEHAHAPSGSLNNDIGVPATILNAPDDCDALVLEMGMRGFGEIKRLCDVAMPHIGVLTNIGDAHGERVGGREGVARAKFELIDSLPADGVAILNSDDEAMVERMGAVSSRLFTYGSSSESNLRWKALGYDTNGCATGIFTCSGETAEVRVPFPGEHMVANAAAAVAVGISCGINIHASVAALKNATGQWGRMSWRTGNRGLRVLDDSYNANTLSMKAALHALANADGVRVAVLGAMAEVPDAEIAHQLIAEEAKALGITVVPFETTLYGGEALSLQEVLAKVRSLKPTTVLVKGSRAAATERVVTKLVLEY